MNGVCNLLGINWTIELLTLRWLRAGAKIILNLYFYYQFMFCLSAACLPISICGKFRLFTMHVRIDNSVHHAMREQWTSRAETTTTKTPIKNTSLFHSQVCGITNRSYTYARLRDHCAALATRLQTKFQLTNGDVVAVCLHNIPEYPIAVFGAIEAGCVVTTVNPIYTVGEWFRFRFFSSQRILFKISRLAKSNTQ